MADNSRRQHHVNLAVAYNVWQYYQVTADIGRSAGPDSDQALARPAGKIEGHLQ